jgi:peptidoglycan/LPS O-acetylase OafA/YrhL
VPIRNRAPPIVSAVPRRSGFAYQPALDGVRALAVAMVLVFHAGLGWMSGGYVGVSVFFTLSGYLITSLALVEHERTGALDVRAFYGRRIRRLLPASLLCLVAVVALTAGGLFAGVDHLRRDVWAAIIPVYNWVLLAGGRSYADLVAGVGDPASPLDHYWSLAIEEQFYWVWPLALVGVFALRRGTRLVAVAILVAAAAAAAPLIHAVWGADATYWATPARLGEILVGALIALLLHRPAVAPGRMPAAVRWLAPAGLVVIVWAATTWPAGSGPAYVGWLPVFALASGALIVGLQVESPLRRILSVRPIVFVGVISYGIYLFHWPIYAVLDRQRTGLDDAPLFAVRVAVTLAVAVLSFLLLERPVRLARRVRWRTTATAALAGGAAVIALATLLPTEQPAYWITTGAELQRAALEPVDSVAPVAVVTTTTPARGPAVAAPERSQSTTLPALSRPVRVVVVGDSTASATGQGLVAWAAEHRELARVSVLWAPAFGFMRRGDPVGLDAEFAAACDRLSRQLPGELRRLRPDVVMLMSTIADVEDRSFADGILAPPAAVFINRLTADYVRFVDELVGAGVPHVALVVPPRPGLPLPGLDSARWEGLRDGIERVAGRRPDVVTLVDLAAWDADHATQGRRPDGLHYSEAAATEIAEGFLAPLLIDAAVS